ncbi:MAG TPA: ATP-dependent DNA helicase RecG [Candidatus Binatia bacterium]|nr:ATP-dependent DNA helicase RecG [Candidatus Binatia bacterium]
MADDRLEELIASAKPPLRFVRDADAGARGRARLPVRAWIARLPELRTSRPSARGRIADLESVLTELESAPVERQGQLAGRALELLEELENGGRESADPERSGSGRRLAPAASGTGAAPRERAEPPRERPAAAPEPAVARAEATLADVDAWSRAAASPILSVAGVGPARAAELERFGLRTVEDLLYHVPFRYEDRRSLARVGDLEPGTSASAIVAIRSIHERRVGRGGRRSVLSAIAEDESGRLELVWYHQIRWFRSRLKVGSRWLVHGRVEHGYDAALRIVHPELEPAEDREAGAAAAPRIVPVYEKPTQMPASAIRRIAHAAVDAHADLVPDGVPRAVRSRLRLMPLAVALRGVHRPGPDADVAALGAARSPAHRSIVFDELFFVQLGLLLRKAQVARETGIAFDGPGDLERRMVDALPFPLTAAQRRVIGEIAADQRAPHPMHRLLQGDVGSGKTVVAVAAALRAIECGWQAAIMAPTELLAEQHWTTVQRVAGGLGPTLWFLTGVATAAERRSILPRLAAGEPGLVVGTHALIQEDVAFGRLGLAVIDEQHRFGVLQRAALSKRTPGGVAPDILLMTATPIPRTLALSVYGDLDLSYLDEMPPGRKPVVTRVFSMSQRRRAYELVRKEVAAGRQAYVVYPLVEESEASDLRDATSGAEELRSEVFPDLRVGLVHGRMPAAEREAVMRAFKAGEYDVLVATTVIEVGIDVPNASVIVIEHAERFGLAQLHQLRGRVGRGSDASYAFLVADWAQSKEARERLRVMTETTDGLRIAEADLAIRGPGALLGTRQAGIPDFRVANLLRDADVLRQARAAAEEVLAEDPHLREPRFAVLARILETRWAGRLGLARVG